MVVINFFGIILELINRPINQQVIMEKEKRLLTKEMIAALKQVRSLQESGNPFSVETIKQPLTNLYSENLIEPTTVEIDGNKVTSCEITNFGWEVLKKLDA